MRLNQFFLTQTYRTHPSDFHWANGSYKLFGQNVANTNEYRISITCDAKTSDL